MVPIPLGNLNLHPRPGCLRSGTEARGHFSLQHLQPGRAPCPQHTHTRGVGVHDARGIAPTIGNSQVDDVARHGLLAQRRDGVVREHERVERVDAAPGGLGRVGGDARVRGRETAKGGRAHHWVVVLRARVGDEGDVDACVGAAGEEEGLAAAVAFFARCAEDEYLAGE